MDRPAGSTRAATRGCSRPGCVAAPPPCRSTQDPSRALRLAYPSHTIHGLCMRWQSRQVCHRKRHRTGGALLQGLARELDDGEDCRAERAGAEAGPQRPAHAAERAAPQRVRLPRRRKIPGGGSQQPSQLIKRLQPLTYEYPGSYMPEALKSAWFPGSHHQRCICQTLQESWACQHVGHEAGGQRVGRTTAQWCR